MSRKPRRSFTADQKAALLRRHYVEKVPVSQLCEESDLQPSLFYYWQKQFFENAAAALQPATAAPRSTALEAKVDALEKQLAKKDEVIAWVTEEHVKLKKSWGALNGSVWVQPDIRDSVVDFTKEWSERTEIPADRFIAWVGIQRGKYYGWKQRYGRANEHNGRIPRDHWLTPIEKQAILDYHEGHPLDGYRRLTYMMIDADIVAASPSTVHRVLRAAGRLDRWNRNASKKGTGFVQPLQPHEHWHIDISYLNVAGTFYYLCSILDGCSRFIVHWEIREAMKEADIERLVERARELHPGVSPRIISDNGPQFIAGDFKKYIRLTGMTHVRTAPYYPQSNGKIERMHKTLKGDAIRLKNPATLEEARHVVAAFVEHYNHHRLHSAIDYVTPADRLEGRHKVITTERDRKLESAREQRAAWRQGARKPFHPPPSSPELLACHP